MLKTCTPNSIGNALGQFGFLHQCEVDLPGVERPNQAVRRGAKSAQQATGEWADVAVYRAVGVVDDLCDCPARIKRRRGKRSRVDLKGVVRRSSAQQYRHAGDKVGPLCGLVIAVRELSGVDIHRDGKRVASMPETNAAQAPAADDFVQDATLVQKALAGSEG